MKQLTTEQLQIIEKALIEKCNFKDFDDVRIEIVDHISSDIEEEIALKGTSFDQAFIMVMTKWNPMILPKTWSRYENIPYIVAKLWKSLDWKFNYSLIPVSIAISLIAYFLQLNWVSMNYLLLLILLVGVLANIFLILLKFKNKVNITLSSYALEDIYLQTLGLFALLIINIFFISDGPNEIIFPIFWCGIYASLKMLGKALVMHKHIKIENQLLKMV